MHWICPYCYHAQTVTQTKTSQINQAFSVMDSTLGDFGLKGVAIGCSNQDCRRVAITVSVVRGEGTIHGSIRNAIPVLARKLMPEGRAKPQPDYIPKAIRDDYSEACLISDLSPKAAATLARRCLQGMIRDFCGISKSTLAAEINALLNAVGDGTAPREVSVESVTAIDHVRTVGNIGAHMEKDVDLIVEVDAAEANLLIDLIESLFADWYVERHVRAKRFAAISAVAADKQAARLEGREQKAIAAPNQAASLTTPASPPAADPEGASPSAPGRS